MHSLTRCRYSKWSHIRYLKIKYQNISNSVPQTVLKIISAQIVYRIVTAVTILKTINGIQWDIF